MPSYNDLRFQLQHDGQLADIVPIIAALELEWGKRSVWEDEDQHELSADAAYEIRQRYNPEGITPDAA